MLANLKNSAVATGLEMSVFFPVPKKGNAKECFILSTIVLILHASNVMLKIFQAGLQCMRTKNFQMYKLSLEKAENQRSNCYHHRKSKRIPEKHLPLLH